LEKERFQSDINAQNKKMEKAQNSFLASYNNVKAVRGGEFDESKEAIEISSY
jgi:hypothetical protein